MMSSVLIVCRKCGHERPVTRDEVVTGRWKHAPCVCCGYVRSVQMDTPWKPSNPMDADDVTAGDAR